MISFSEFAASRQERGVTTCLFVATGPSAVHAAAYAHRGDVAVIGEAGLALPERRLGIVFFNNWKRANASRVLFDRTDCILSPETIHDDDTGAVHAVSELDWIPQDKLVTWPRRKRKIRSIVKRMRDAVKTKELLPFSFSVRCLLALFLLGYRTILAFGNDGGFSHAPGMLGADDPSYSYTPRANQVKKMGRIIAQESETRCHFWPDIPAEAA